LTPEALEKLTAALTSRWNGNLAPGRLTREARAELLGVSVATAARILAREGVDRATLSHAFKMVGLTWDDSYCEPVTSEPDAAVRPAREQPIRRPLSPLWGRTLIVGSLTSALILATGQQSIFARHPAGDAWRPAFHKALADGTASYHRGDYASAELQLGRAIEMAREHEAARYLSSAIRMAADLSSAQGDLEEAKERYVDALSLRRAFEDDPARPAILEALGALEARTGEYPPAQAHLDESHAGFRKAGDPVGVAMAKRNLGTLAFLQGDYALAQTWFASSLEAVSGRNKPDIETDVRARQALVLRDTGSLAQARSELEACLDYWMSREHPRWIAVTEFQLGTVEVRDRRTEAARSMLRRSLEGFRKVGDKAGAAEASQWLHELDENRTPPQ